MADSSEEGDAKSGDLVEEACLLANGKKYISCGCKRSKQAMEKKGKFSSF